MPASCIYASWHMCSIFALGNADAAQFEVQHLLMFLLCSLLIQDF